MDARPVGGARPAALWRRIVGWWIDAFVLVIVASVVIYMVALVSVAAETDEPSDGATILATLVVLTCVLTVEAVIQITGTSAGLALTRTTIADAAGTAPGVGRGLARLSLALFPWVASLVIAAMVGNQSVAGFVLALPLLSFVPVALDRHRRLAHDLLTGTCVVALPRAPEPLVVPSGATSRTTAMSEPGDTLPPPGTM